MPTLEEKLRLHQRQLNDVIQRCHADGKLVIRNTTDPIEEAKCYNAPAITGDLRATGEKIGVQDTNRIIFSTTYLASSRSKVPNRMLQPNKIFVGFNIEESKIIEAARMDPFTEAMPNSKGRESYRARLKGATFLTKRSGQPNPTADELLSRVAPFKPHMLFFSKRDYASSTPFYEVTLKLFIQSILCIGITGDSFSTDEKDRALIEQLIQLQIGYRNVLGDLIPIVIYNNQSEPLRLNLLGHAVTLPPNACYVVPNSILEEYGRGFTVDDFVEEEVGKRELYRTEIAEALEKLPNTSEYERPHKLHRDPRQKIDDYAELPEECPGIEHLAFRLKQYLHALDNHELRINYFALVNDLALAHTFSPSLSFR